MKSARGWTGRDIEAVLYVIRLCFRVTPSHLIVGLLQCIKTCKMFLSRDQIIEEKQFPTQKSTPLISFGLFCTLLIRLLHFTSPLPRSGYQSCGQIDIKYCLLETHTVVRLNPVLLHIFLVSRWWHRMVSSRAPQ